jgi:hypothetical protein
MTTPANWKQDDDLIITGDLSGEDADKIFSGYKTLKP